MLEYSENSLSIYKKLYFAEGETKPEQVHDRVARFIADDEEQYKAFKKLMDENVFRPNSPVFINSARPIKHAWDGQLFACFILPLSDDLESIVEMWSTAAKVYASGAGIGVPITNLREKGSSISSGGTASGACGYIQVLEVEAQRVRSGGKSRRSAGLLSCKYTHPEIEDLVNLKENGDYQSFNISILVDDKLMKAVSEGKENTIDLISPNGNKKVGEISSTKLWNMICEQSWKTGDPGLLFYNACNDYYPFPSQGEVIASNPCGEYLSKSNTCCCLGSINLSKCISILPENSKIFDYTKFQEYISTAVQFLDNVIDRTTYLTKDFEKVTKECRPIGLGIMAFSDVLFDLGLPYNSDCAMELFEKICYNLEYYAILESIELAKKKGPINIPFEDLQHFEKLLKYYTRKDDFVLKSFQEHGIRNSVRTSIAPTGCLHSNSLVLTSNGLCKIKDMKEECNEFDSSVQWNDFTKPISVIQENNSERAESFFNNGISKTIKITTKNGYSIEGTPNHKLRIIDNNGDYTWKKISDIIDTDMICLRIGGHEDVLLEKKYVELNTNVNLSGLKNKEIKIPKNLDEDLAFLIGYYMGNGSLHRDGIRMHVGDGYESEIEIIKCFKTVFNKDLSYKENHNKRNCNCSSYYFTSRAIKDFFELNKFSKEKGNNGEGANSTFIPDQILKSKTSVLCSFIKGLFDSDGSCLACNIGNVSVSFSTVSKTMATQLQIALLSLGIVTIKRTMKKKDVESYGKRDIYELRIKSVYDASIFKDKIGFTSPKKQCILNSLIIKENKGRILKHKLLWSEFISETQEYLTKKEKQVLHQYINSNTGSLITAKNILDRIPIFYENTRIGKLIKNNIFVDAIKQISFDESDTYDIFVPNNNCYIANGFVSHNSISISADCSYSFEPCFALVWEKELAETHEKMYFTNPIFEKWLDNYYKNKTSDFSKKIVFQKIIENGGSCKGIPEIPEDIQNIFVTAHDISYDDKLRMQAAGQRYISLGISSTCNLPNSATIEDISETYIKAWKYGLKGITVYRDGSHSWQPVNFGKKECVEVKSEKYTRPITRSGKTIEIKSPEGSLYVTINKDDSTGKPIEIFLRMGKQGNKINLLIDALSRCISKALQGANTLPEFASTLRGNKDDSPFYFRLSEDQEKPFQAESIVDAVGIILDSFGNDTYIKLTDDQGNLYELCPSCNKFTLSRALGCRNGACINPECGYSSCG